MTASTFYLSSTVAASSNHLSLVTSAPGTATISTGWTVGTTAPTAYSAMAAGVERAASTFGSTALPDGTGPSNTLGDCFRTSSTLDGRWAAGTWTLSVPMIAVTAGGAADVAAVFRVWRGESATGSDAVEITSGLQTGSTLTNLTTAEQISTLAFALDGIGVVGEYLFLQVALKIIGVGGGATDDALLRVGSAATLVTPNWVPADLTLYDVVLGGQGYRIQWDGYQRGRAQTQPPTINTDANAIANTLNGVSFNQTAWQGGTGSSATSSGNNTLSSAPGIDPIGSTGAFKVGPRILSSVVTSCSGITALAVASAAAVYAGGDNGMLYRQGSTIDEWTSIGAVSSGGRINSIAAGDMSVNTTHLSRVWGGNSSNGQLFSWDGAALNQGTTANLGNASSKFPLAAIHAVWAPPAAATHETHWDYSLVGTPGSATGYFYTNSSGSTAKDGAVIGITAGGQLICNAITSIWITSASGATPRSNIAWFVSSTATYTFGTVKPFKSDWFGPVLATAGTLYDPTTMPYTSGRGIFQLASSSGVIFMVANSSVPNGAIYMGGGASGATGARFLGPTMTQVASFANSYPVAAANLGTKSYLVDSIGTLYTIDAAFSSISDNFTATVTPVATGITMGYGPPTAMHNYSSAVWIGFQAGSKIMYRRYGPSSNGGGNVLSEPIYGASCQATSGSFNAAAVLGNNFYLGVNNGAATPIYRVDNTAYTTDAVSAVSINYVAGLDGTNKKFKSVTIQHDALASGDSITVASQVDQSGSWAVASGNGSTVGAISSKFTFTGTTLGNQIQIKVTLTSGSTSTTPRVTAWLFDSTAQQDFLREWKIGLRLEHASGYPLGLKDGSADPQTGAAVSDINWTMFQAGDTLRYRDLGGTIYDVEIWDYNEKLAPGQPQVFGLQFAGDLTIREVA